MGNFITAKKYLGQHFLKDLNIARKITEALHAEKFSGVLEIGPGMGVLTDFLVNIPGINLRVIEIDRESVAFLVKKYSREPSFIIEGDFLTADLTALFPGPFAVIGNFPYFISSQILFRIFEHRNLIPEVVGMIQKEVAERICHGPGSRTYGILSVLLQAYYNPEYLFTVGESVFIPPPKVKSAVIRLTRNERLVLDCDEEFFIRVVKTGFNQRRKMLGNALKPLGLKVPGEFSQKRAEELSVEDFIMLTANLGNRVF